MCTEGNRQVVKVVGHFGQGSGERGGDVAEKGYFYVRLASTGCGHPYALLHGQRYARPKNPTGSPDLLATLADHADAI